MARQAGPHFFTGTIEGLTFYQLNGKYYVRAKSSLTRKQFQTRPAFARSREKAAQFGAAAKLVKTFYRQLPKAARRHGLFGKLTGTATRLLQAGQPSEAVLVYLQSMVAVAPQPTAPQPVKGALSLSRWQVTKRGKLEKPAAITENSLSFSLQSHHTGSNALKETESPRAGYPTGAQSTSSHNAALKHYWLAPIVQEE